MNVYNQKVLDTNDVAQRVIDALGDFHNDGLIKGSTLRSKTNYTNLIKAINDADREVTRDSQIHRLVVVYAPPGESSIIFDQNYQYVSEIIKGIQNADLSPRGLIYFIPKHDYVNVVEIFSRYIDVFKKYPTGAEEPEYQLRKIGLSELRGKGRQDRNSIYRRLSYKDPVVENKATFIPDENRLILGQPITDGGFLRFEGRIFAGLVNVNKIPEADKSKDNYNAYKIVSPHTAHRLLVNTAIFHSLPISSQNARAVAAESMMREKRDYLKMKPRDSNVVIPHFHL